MWLVGNVNVENVARESVGMLGELRIPFVLPRRLKRRHKVKVRYVGYHAGSFLARIQLNNYEVSTKDERADNGWRSCIKEMRMRIEADGTDIMHENSMVRYVRFQDERAVNSTENTNFLCFPATFATEAAEQSGGVVLINSIYRPMATHRSHHQLEDFGVGFIDPSTSKLEIVLTAEHQKQDFVGFGFRDDEYSYEPNVRMDTISIVLELV